MQFTCSDGNKASTFRDLRGRDPPANGQQGFRIRDPYFYRQTRLLTDWPS
jgi:hypothetical protein